MEKRSNDLPVLVVAPFGRDAELISQTLQRAHIAAEIYRDPARALPKLHNGSGALLVEEEVFTDPVEKELAAALQSQPAWSDAPVIVLTNKHSRHVRAWRLARLRRILRHATLLERPTRPEVLVSAVEMALRARSRQLQIRDVLERLQRSEARYRSLVTATASIVWATDLHGNIVEPLPSWEAYTGQTFAQYAGRRWVDAIHPADRDSAVAAISQAMSRLHPFQLEFRLRCRDGSCRCVLARGVPVFRNDTHTLQEWVGTCTDVQDKKDAERALKKTERLALAGQLSATIAHEINNPLEAVTNLIYLIGTLTKEDEIRQYAQMAENELSRVAEISGQTLRFYRASKNCEPTDVADLMESLLTLFRPKFSRRALTLAKGLESGTSVVAFANELRQLFANLISNAVDATPPGGRIIVRVRPALNSRTARNGVRVTIADTGCGIPDSIKARIYEPFMTTKGESGTGLGLWVSHDIVRRHGGDIRIKSRSEDPKGTVFSIFLPADTQPEQQLSSSNTA